MGLDSIDADDLENVCGKGRQSLLRTLGEVMSSLQRKPRQLIVTSLEQDLLATALNPPALTTYTQQAGGGRFRGLPAIIHYSGCRTTRM